MAFIGGTATAAAAGATAAAPTILSAGNALGGSSGSSDSWNIGQNQSYNYSLGSSANSAWNNSYGYNNAYGYSDGWENSENWGSSWNDSYGENTSNSWGNSYSENYGRTFGAEASARDLEYAREANKVQGNMWQDQARYNAEQAALDREFQAYMSNTSYQRAVADLLKAGLNPILAVGGQASTPIGATASAGLSTAAKGVSHADSYSGGYSRGNSGSSSYGYNRSNGGSNNYGYSNSRNRSENWNKGENWSAGESSGWSKNYGEGYSDGYNLGRSTSQTTNNIREIAGTAIEATKEAMNIGTNAAKKIGSDYKETLSNKFRNPFKSGQRLQNKANIRSGKSHGTF